MDRVRVRPARHAGDVSGFPAGAYLRLAAGDRRAADVHTRIDSAGLPVRHQTRRKGRPYTLVLTKTGELFAREKDARQQAVSDLAWLTSAWGDG